MHKYIILDIHKNTIMKSRNPSFFDDVFPCRIRGEDQGSEKELENDPSDSDQNEEIDELRRSSLTEICWAI